MYLPSLEITHNLPGWNEEVGCRCPYDIDLISNRDVSIRVFPLTYNFDNETNSERILFRSRFCFVFLCW